MGKLGLLAVLLGTATGRRSPLLRAGGLAVLGTVAYKAYQNWQASQRGEKDTAAPRPQRQSRPAPQSSTLSKR